MNGLLEFLPQLYPVFFITGLFVLMYKLVGWARQRKTAAVTVGVLVQMMLPDPNVEKTIQVVAEQKGETRKAEQHNDEPDESDDNS